MGAFADEHRKAFVVWLRTGLIPRPESIDDVEVKFNPWHDPQNGRFTFANTGRYYGRWQSGGFTGGGGGGFGGAGASESWGNERVSRRRQANPASRPNGSSQTSRVALSGLKPELALSVRAQELRRVVSNGYEYQIDVQGRTRRVSGTLTISAGQTRSRSAQAQAGGVDRRPGDDGGHYIARRFRGPKDAFNHFAQDSNFNRGGYRALEDQWARAQRQGKRVWVKIAPAYDGTSQRPSVINVLVYDRWIWREPEIPERACGDKPWQAMMSSVC